MNVVSKLKILHNDYEVEFVDNLHEGEDELYGQIDCINQKISVRTGLSESQRLSTILHEAIHGIDEVYRIGLEEEQVARLGNALYMFINDNEEMFK